MQSDEGEDKVATSADSNRDPWGRSLTATLRRWWWLPLVLALVGALLGGIAGKAAPKTAEATLKVQTTAAEGAGLAEAVQSAVMEAGTREVYQDAAAKAGVTAKDLRKDSTIVNVLQSSVLSVKVTSSTAEKAAAEANALAEAAVARSTQRLSDELETLTQTTGKLIREDTLSVRAAEEQRVMRLGGSLADSQAQLLTQSRRLTLLQAAEADQVQSVSVGMMAAMGLLGGLLAGVALALLFGGRRGKMGSIAEMRRLYPDVEFVPARELPTVMSMEAATADCVVLTGVRAPAGAVRGLVEPVTAGIRATGRDVAVTDDVARLGQQSMGHDGTPSVTVLQTPMSNAVIKRAARDDRAVLFTLVRPHKTRFEWLDEHIHQFGARSYVVVDG
ncbi:hypothetical protein [Gephyromycinifex aptenodytis]|uniref:hypothetical protein n=1 Tax=Gephyromycinifex aptenodytis TaxID=2716227 RepID=UPI001446FDF0|nr:hypothetical protein [Gephyromycinifex aptenodytis]